MSGKTAPFALKSAITTGILGSPESIHLHSCKTQPLALFYDLNVFENGLKNVQNAFGKGFMHAIAVKSNPVCSMLELAMKQGLGAECASIGEVLNCLKVGFLPDKIVYDSPVKTASEIRFALERGIHINADSIQEIHIINEELQKLKKTNSTIGLRVNPLVGKGEIHELSTATATSKFGVALNEHFKGEVLECYAKYPWLTAMHVHIGSQSYGVTELANGLRTAVLFALEVNDHLGRNQVDVFDIGGGLPVNRDDDEISPTFDDYAGKLKSIIPELFPSNGVFRRVVTEFGQALNAKTGWLASRVEYVKQSGSEDVDIILSHIGADLCMRTCYCPNQRKYQRRIEIYDRDGCLKTGKKRCYNIAGPLCFSGDVIKYNIHLPEVIRGDYIVVLDCGANSLSVFNRHCSRFAPSVFGYRKRENESVEFTVLKEAETTEELLKFWGDKNQLSPK